MIVGYCIHSIVSTLKMSLDGSKALAIENNDQRSWYFVTDFVIFTSPVDLFEFKTGVMIVLRFRRLSPSSLAMTKSFI